MTAALAQLTLGTAAAAPGGATEARCAGSWTVHGIAGLAEQIEVLAWPAEGELVIDGSAISAFDTSGAWLLHRTVRELEKRGRVVRIQGLRSGFQSLLQLVVSRTPTEVAAAVASPGVLLSLE